MFQGAKQGSDRSKQNVYRISKSAQRSSPGFGDQRSNRSQSSEGHVYSTRSRPDRFPALPPIRRYKKCSICSTTYRDGTERNKLCELKRTPSLKNVFLTRYADRTEFRISCGSKLESILASLVLLLLFVVLFLTLFWVLHYREGLGSQGSMNMWLNWHPVAMVTGFIAMSGTSMLLPKLCFLLKPTHVTILQTFLHICVALCVVFGLIIVLDYHNQSQPSIPNFKSMHSWLGLGILGLYGLQFILGVFGFFVSNSFEEADCNMPSSITGFQKLLASISFGLATVNCLTGFSECIFGLKDGGSEEIVFVNSLGVICLLSGVAVIVLLKCG